jgi:hypothetical protein
MANSYLVKKNTTASIEGVEGYTHFAGDVISELELPGHVRESIDKGVSWYTQTFEKLTEKEAEQLRKKATAVEGKRQAPNGQVIDPPWDDYIGLHPKEVIKRMETLSADDAEKVRQYERPGMNRETIINFVVPSEREPWNEYDQMATRDILDKLDILDPQSVQDTIVYELMHKKRPAILEFQPEEDGDNDSNKFPVGAGVEED